MNLPYGYLGDKHIKVVYRGTYEYDFGLSPGRVYEVFAHDKAGSDKGNREDMLSVRFDDPKDSCGGVVSYFANDFELIEDWSI